MRNFCTNCGDEILNPYHEYCDDCYQELSFDKCQCGNSKHIYDDLCKDCYYEEIYENNKKEFGFALCPFCGKEFVFSEYLHKIIIDEKTRLICNLITHYRHNHQQSWNYSANYISSNYGQDAYERAKIKHNNRAKRQILRKHVDWLKLNNIEKRNFLELRDNDEKTLELIEKTFG